MGPSLEREVELYTFDALRAQEAKRAAAPNAVTLQTPADTHRSADEQQLKESAQEATDPRLRGLSSAARELLTEASNDRQGVIMSLQTLEGGSVQKNGKSFAERGNPRAAARWRSAVEELRRNGLVEDRAGKGEAYFITGEGYGVAELIQQQ